MALFSRKQRPPTPRHSPEPAPTITAADLADAAALMEWWDASLGNNDAVWGCLERIALRAGFKGQDATMQEVISGKDPHDVIQRPWRWLAAVATVAEQAGDQLLPGRIFLFANLYKTTIVTLMNPATMMEIGLDPLGDPAYREMAHATLASLADLPPDTIIHQSSTGSASVGYILALAGDVVGTGAGPTSV